MTTGWLVAVGAVAMGLTQLSESQVRFALTAHQVAQALAEKGIQVSDSQVTLVANVVATEALPKLEFLSVAPSGSMLNGVQSEGRTWIRMVCRSRGVCLPFYAIVVEPEGRAANASLVSSIHPLSGGALLEPKSEITMQAGVHATLVLNDQRSQIRVSVISLQKGAAGSRIRVESRDHKQIYIGEVVSSTQLKASF